MLRYKLKLKYERSIIENYRSHFNELKTIFSTYSYTTNPVKLKKHFPIVYGLSYDRILEKYKPHIRSVSCSLWSIKIKEQLDEYINTVERRFNWVSLLGSDLETSLIHHILGINILLPSTYAHTITKYNKDQILEGLPDLEHTNFDVIYKIKTENFHLCADISKGTLCNFILICCIHSSRIYHILFHYDKEYIVYNEEVYKNEDYIKNKFANPM
jgi:hypothetical protein